MQFTEHISAEMIERYRSKTSVPAEVLAVQSHIVACESCREKLAQILETEKAFSAVRSGFAFDEFSDEPEHLPFEQLAFFVDGKLDEVEREITESHLAICPECAKDAADLRKYQTIAAAPVLASEAKKSLVESNAKSFWQRLFAFDSIGSFAPVAAVLLIVFSFGAWLLFRTGQTTEIVQGNTNKNTPVTASPSASISNPVNNSAYTNVSPETLPTPDVSPSPQTENPPTNNEALLALDDGQITVDENGDVKGLENLSPAAQKAIQQSLKTGKVSASNAISSLGGSGGVLMSGGNEANGVPFALTTPVGKVIRESQPVLRWKALKDATAYSVAIVDDKFRVVAESGKLNSTVWKSPKPLPRGANYSWQVTATKSDGTETVSPSSPAPQAKFRVLDQAALNEISRLEKSADKSHLALGVLYAQAGLTNEARREFEILVKQNPRSKLARKLLSSVGK